MLPYFVAKVPGYQPRLSVHMLPFSMIFLTLYFYKPLKKLLEDKKIKVSIIKPNDNNLFKKTKKADILITAVGKPFFIKKEMVKKNSIIIDIGTNKIDKKHIVGDVDYANVLKNVNYITPVPGGVGPMTVAMLLYNTLKLHKIKNNIK